jgi:hypothetical protein
MCSSISLVAELVASHKRAIGQRRRNMTVSQSQGSMSPISVGIRLAENPQTSLEFATLSLDLFNKLYPNSDQTIPDIHGKFVSMQYFGSSELTDAMVYPVTVSKQLTGHENTGFSLPSVRLWFPLLCLFPNLKI